mgnify:FL=1
MRRTEGASPEELQALVTESLKVKQQFEQVALQYVFGIIGDYKRLVADEKVDPREALRRLNVPPETDLPGIIRRIGQLPENVPERNQFFFEEK